MTIEVPRVRVTRQVIAGSRVWEVGEYPTSLITNVDALYRTADSLEENKVPVNERSVVYISNHAEKKLQNLTSEPTVPEYEEEEIEETEELSDVEVDSVLSLYPSKEEFDELNADNQKAVLAELVADEELTDEELYAVLNQYLEVATAKTVIKIINEELAKFE